MTIDPAELARKKRRHRNERIAAVIIVVILALGTLAAVWFGRRAKEEALRDTRYIPKETKITPEIEMLREYVRIDTTTPAGIAAGANWIAAELQKRGVKAEIIESTPGYLNVYARIKGQQPGGGLLLMNHIDVVPPGNGWAQPPFGGKIVFNELHGRGTLDMKALGICQLLAFAKVAGSGRPPTHDLVFLATAEEEQGSNNGVLWLFEHRPDLFEGIETGVTEGGLAETMSERMTYFGVEIGGKPLTTIRLEAPAAEPLRQARFRLERQFMHPYADRVLPEVRAFFRDIAPTRIKFGQYLRDIDRTINRGELWQLPPSYREFLQDTIRATAPYADGDHWSMRVSMVTLPDTVPDERIAAVRAEVEPYGVRVAEVLRKQGPIPLSSTDSRTFHLLVDQAKRQYGVHAGRQLLYQAMTDCRYLRMRGLACYGISPYPVNIFQATSIHRTDERIRLDWFLEGVRYVDEFAQAWAAGR